MSRKKIRKKKQSKRAGGDKKRAFFSSFVPQWDPVSGEVDVRATAWEVDEADLGFMDHYRRAHELMPPPRSILMDPEEYLDEMGPSIELLKRAQGNETVQPDELLRALGILGHTPNDWSLKALADFSESSHVLAPVANLALGECASLYGEFKGSARAS